jgi:para-aminobenzoate synthetase/4-amino-4-deoxychorismate lyase
LTAPSLYFLYFDFPTTTNANANHPLTTTPTPKTRLFFTDPVEIITTNQIEQVQACLERVVERAASEGLYAAGYIAYDAAPAFDKAFRVPGFGGAESHPNTGLPLIWFGLFEKPTPTPPSNQEVDLAAKTKKFFFASEWERALAGLDAYTAKIEAIHQAIAAGDTYQVNYTLRLKAQLGAEFDDLDFYRRISAAQSEAANHGYYACLNLGDYGIFSASPELFFQLHPDGRIVTRPMKGTARRGRWIAEDHANAEWLANSAKNQAENLMIVDLLRNDLGRIAQTGTVTVPTLFAVEPYRTVWQMTSTVEAKLRADLGVADIFRALFPSGSVTGAPKTSSMQLISQLENSPRGVYTGAIGYIEPGAKAALFNVAIRTLVVDYRNAQAEYGVGGGITWDSQAQEEYEEVKAKSAILHQVAQTPVQTQLASVGLFETLRLEPSATAASLVECNNPFLTEATSNIEASVAANTCKNIAIGSLEYQYLLLERHLARLEASLQYFNSAVQLDREQACHLLAQHAAKLLEEQAQQGDSASASAYRVRLVADLSGQIQIDSNSPKLAALAPTKMPQLVTLAKQAIARNELSLYHKTTNRSLYEQRRLEYVGTGEQATKSFDTLLWNEDGELTEFTIGNLVVELAGEGQLWTPPLTSGLLAGTLRAELLALSHITERTLYLTDLPKLRRMWLINSVRGWVAVQLHT